jgi:hypothetical protein
MPGAVPIARVAPMDELERVLDRLVADGSLTAEQADAVRAGVAGERTRRRPRIGEALGFLGGTVAVVSALALASQFWADLRVGAQVALLVLTGVALLAAGRWAGPRQESAAGRLAGLLWALAVLALAAAVWVGLEPRPGTSDAVAWLATGLAAIAVGVPLWRMRVGALQQLPVLGGVLTALLGGLDAALSTGFESAAGLVVWTVGCVWAVHAEGRWLAPRRAGLVLGAVTALIGAQFLSATDRGLGLTLAALTVAALLAAAVRVSEAVLLGLGTAGAAVFLPQILDAVFPDAIGGPAITFVVGVLLLAGGLAMARMTKGAGDER